MTEEYNRERYNKKYEFEIKTGRMPNESFEDCCSSHITDRYFDISA